MAGMSEAFRRELAGIVGEAQLSADGTVRELFAIDGEVPDCVIYPNSAEKVALA